MSSNLHEELLDDDDQKLDEFDAGEADGTTGDENVSGGEGDKNDYGDDVEEEEVGSEEKKSTLTPEQLQALLDEEEGVDSEGVTIPKARFDEVNQRRKTAEAEAEAMRLEREKETHDVAKITAALKEKIRAYHDALVDGKTDEAMNIMDEIEEARARMARESALEAVREERARTTAESEMESAKARANEIIAELPYLKKGSPEANPEAIEYFSHLRDKHMAEGKGRVAAMNAALESVEKLFSRQGAAPSPEDARRKENLARKIDAAGRQPPRAPVGVGSRAAGTTTPMDIESMTDEEFDALPEREKAKLRGDLT